VNRESAIDFNVQPTTTMTTPHKLVKFEGASYFIGKCRAGDYVVHRWKSSDSTGYCGAALTFLRDNGYEQEVKGPYLMGFDWRDYKALVSHLKMPELNQKAFKVTVGTKVEKRTSVGVSYDDFGEIVEAALMAFQESRKAEGGYKLTMVAGRSHESLLGRMMTMKKMTWVVGCRVLVVVLWSKVGFIDPFFHMKSVPLSRLVLSPPFLFFSHVILYTLIDLYVSLYFIYVALFTLLSVNFFSRFWL
jgi:hypothetical protein